MLWITHKISIICYVSIMSAGLHDIGTRRGNVFASHLADWRSFTFSMIPLLLFFTSRLMRETVRRQALTALAPGRDRSGRE